VTITPAAPIANSTQTAAIRRPRAIGRLGTTARVLVGAALLALGIIAGGGWIAWWQLALGIVGILAIVLVAQFARLAVTNRPLSQTNHLANCLNCAAVAALLTASPTRDATLVFLGSSMLLAAARGYGGCETLSISNWTLRRDDQVGCLLFGPVDQFEARPERQTP
jgi:hypothetical protein